MRILVNGAVAQTLTEPLSHAFNPLGTTGTERLDLELALNDLLPESGDAWIVVEAGLALEENWDLDCDGIPDTGDNNRDGEIDWRDIEEYVGAEEEPLGPCFDAVGPLTDPPAPTSRDDVLYLYQSVAPDGYPLAFSNPLLIDRDGDGWTAPGLR